MPLGSHGTYCKCTSIFPGTTAALCNGLWSLLPILVLFGLALPQHLCDFFRRRQQFSKQLSYDIEMVYLRSSNGSTIQYIYYGRSLSRPIRKYQYRVTKGEWDSSNSTETAQLVFNDLLPSALLQLSRSRRSPTVRIGATAVPCIEVKNVPNDSGAGYHRFVRRHFPRCPEHGPRRWQGVQERGYEEQVRIIGRVRIRSQDILPEFAHALDVCGNVTAFGQPHRCELAHGE
ncbi:hypothetical protein BJV78DRAFT_723612 [Lactifluus subvellereus]|nr:hypothetical protein BJV78DRAFT_723612 [Lactifluus subvellereus]